MHLPSQTLCRHTQAHYQSAHTGGGSPQTLTMYSATEYFAIIRHKLRREFRCLERKKIKGRVLDNLRKRLASLLLLRKCQQVPLNRFTLPCRSRDATHTEELK